MLKNFSLKDYLFNLKNTMVANTFLGILHILAQVVVAISMLISAFGLLFYQGFVGFLGFIALLVLIPLASMFTRFWFECLAVIFSINNNLGDMKNALTGGCPCDGCECWEAPTAEVKKTPAKKPSPAKKAPAKKTK